MTPHNVGLTGRQRLQQARLHVGCAVGSRSVHLGQNAEFLRLIKQIFGYAHNEGSRTSSTLTKLFLISSAVWLCGKCFIANTMLRSSKVSRSIPAAVTDKNASIDALVQMSRVTETSSILAMRSRRQGFSCTRTKTSALWNESKPTNLKIPEIAGFCSDDAPTRAAVAVP